MSLALKTSMNEVIEKRRVPIEHFLYSLPPVRETPYGLYGPLLPLRGRAKKGLPGQTASPIAQLVRAPH